MAVGFGLWLLRRRRGLSGAEVLLVAATATLVVPLLLTEMHERYFYLAQVLAVAAAAAVEGRFVAAALLMQLASTSTDLSYLADDQLVKLRLGSMLALVAAITAAMVLVQQLRRAPAVDPWPTTRRPPESLAHRAPAPGAPAAGGR